MGNIVLLDEVTANKIAAGEVIERPASVVKELVENSIDAGSTRIDIAITDGGLSMICVADNGAGMDAGDALLALERHATSKIRNAGDLARISTLGFRGEALPSIAAVSRLTLKTRPKDAVAGSAVMAEGGKILATSETGCPPGTIIEVKDLFFNTPARRKHMKSPSTETGLVSETVNRFAMGYPDISFQLKSNDRLILKTSGGGSLRDCLASIYGADLVRDMLPVEVQRDHARLWGFVGKPMLSRAGRSHQTVYVNGRFVRNRIISEAVERAYHGMLMVGRRPVFIINISVDPEQVDVNVHPAKTEVRLLNPQELGRLITETVAEVLAGSRLIPSTPPRRSGPARRTEPQYAAGLPGLTSPVQTSSSEPEADAVPGHGAGNVTETASEVGTENGGEAWPEPGPGFMPEYAAESLPDYDTESSPEVRRDFPELRPIGQVELTYIVAQGPDGMYLVDQHAAHERVLYEKLMDQPEGGLVSEQLLFPETVRLTHREARVLNDHIISFADLGFVIEHFGGESFLIRAVPSGIAKSGGKEIFLDLLDYFSRERYTITTKALKEKLLITMSCKSAVKANQKMALPEMESLIGQLARCRNPYTCPHGRPTVVHFSGYELEKRFKRVL